MSSFSLQPAAIFSISQLADLLTRGFEDYFVPIHINDAVLLTMIRRDGIDLNESRVLAKDGEPIGVGLIARRGWTSRLAAMGIVSHARNGGAGTWAMQHLTEESRVRGEKEMLLEVIEQNTAAVKLYQKIGFKIMRRLVGYKLEKPPIESSDELKEVDIREMARMISIHGLKDLPWQLSAESIAQHTPPSRAFCLEDSYCLISNLDVEHVAISSVLVNVDLGGTNQGQRLMRAVFSHFPNKVWHVTPIYPEEMNPFFEGLGMQREALSQWQMAIKL